MTQVNRMKVAFYSLGLAMVLVAAVIVGVSRAQVSYAQAEAPTGTGIYINPASATANVGSNTTVSVMVDGTANVLGAQISITFNAAVVNIVDADAGTAGIQITTGDCPVDVVAINDGDNTVGDVFYAAANGISNPACSGTSFTVASIQFTCLAVGTSAVTFVTGDPLGTVLADSNGTDITPGATNGSITCNASTGTISGVVNLQGRSNHSYATVNAYDATTSVLIASTTTNNTGNYALNVPAGNYNVTAVITRYLDSRKNGVAVTAGNTTALNTVTLLGGNANDTPTANTTINVQDTSIITAMFLKNCASVGWDDRSDINDNCTTNIQDTSLATGNFFKSEPVTWP